MSTIITNIGALSGTAGASLAVRPDLSMVWNEWCRAFLLYEEGRGRSECTRKTYSKALARFKRWLDANGLSICDLTTEVLVAYRRSLSSLATASANVNIIALRCFFTWLEAEGVVRNNIARSLDGFKMEHSFQKMPLTIEEQQSLLDHMQGREDVPEVIRLRDYAIVNILLLCGLRSIEIERARCCDVQYKYGQRVLMVWGKGHDTADTPVVLTDEAYAPIEAYLQARGCEPDSREPLFCCHGRNSAGQSLSARRLQAVVKEGLRAIGLDSHEYSTHSLRHSCGSTLLDLGASLSDVRHVLRHKDEKTTLIYVKMKHEEQLIRNSPQHLLDNIFRRK